MERLNRWESRTEWPLAGLAVLFLIVYAAPIAHPTLSVQFARVCEIAIVAIWIVFGVDYVTRLALAPNRWTFVRRNLLDLAALILPMLRPLRLLRLVMLVNVLNRAGQRTLRGRVVIYVTGGTLLLVIVGALAITEAEMGRSDAAIQNLGDGFWWAVTTITTVGYGDMYPITPTGRLVATSLMIAGIALLGVVTATLASWVIDKVAAENQAEAAATRAQVDALTREVRQLRGSIRD